jgi:hypothetical protein
MTASSSSLGITPASESAVALTITMNRIVHCPCWSLKAPGFAAVLASSQTAFRQIDSLLKSLVGISALPGMQLGGKLSS